MKKVPNPRQRVEESFNEVRSRAPRMTPADREAVIVQLAVEHFAEEGFEGTTRDLAAKIGVTQSLLYKYFPNKEALLEKVYERVYVGRWDAEWEHLIVDRSLPLTARLKRFYLMYSDVMLQKDWVRILVFAGLKQSGINEKLFRRLREKIFRKVIEELHHDLKLSQQSTKAEAEIELELVWALHASIFYIGMRRWIYGQAIYAAESPNTEQEIIRDRVQSYLHSAKSLFA